MGATQTKRQSKQVEQDVSDEDALYVTRSPSSARRYNQPIEHDTLDDVLIQKGTTIQRRRSSMANTDSDNSSNVNTPVSKSTTSKAMPTPAKDVNKDISFHKHLPLLAIIVGMVVMALLAMSLTAFASWWKVHQDDMQYGRPRTFQVDAVVGHSDSQSNPTHFIFINLNRHVQIIELPGGDSAHARIYPGPVLFGDGQDLTPITADIRDVNGDGKPDIIVHIQDQQLVLINDGTQFRPLQPGEHVNT